MTTCGMCGLPVHPFASLCHSDIALGLKNARIHRACYRSYILKYFPDGRMAEYMRTNPDAYTAKDEPSPE